MKNNFIVSVYLCDRAYGGPEEGGWYYECGYPAEEAIRFLKSFTDLDAAIIYRIKLQRVLDKIINRGRRPVSSVLSEGEYRAIVDENELPAPYPKYRPHYE